ncbi:MAG: DUF2339 domain-containing protein, partial [Verrucomicrobiota bacterium]|nr:DUF2339 domain-containing protein [Verrucomicrobiota bacterium]
MDPYLGCFILLALVALLVPFVLVIAHARRIKTMETTLRTLAARLAKLEGGAVATTPSAVQVASPPIAVAPEFAAILKSPVPPSPAPVPAQTTAAAPPQIAPRPPRPAIDWESFLGVKLFAWVGGFVLFLGVVFLVKYSFENNLITPSMRIVIGAIIGLVLIAAGWWTARRNYRVPGQSLCATGVVILYADIFGAHAFYGLVSLGAAFALMSLVTVAAFFLAVRLNAQVVVILGLLGGFLTPALLNEQMDAPLRVFGYIALLNCGIAAVALRQRWDYLLVLGALGTALMQLAWATDFNAAKATAGLLIFLGFEAQFLLFAWLRTKRTPPEKWSAAAAALMAAAALAFAYLLLGFDSLATRPGYFFGYTFMADIGLLALALTRKNPARIAAPAGSVVFL